MQPDNTATESWCSDRYHQHCNVAAIQSPASNTNRTALCMRPCIHMHMAINKFSQSTISVSSVCTASGTSLQRVCLTNNLESCTLQLQEINARVFRLLSASTRMQQEQLRNCSLRKAARGKWLNTIFYLKLAIAGYERVDTPIIFQETLFSKSILLQCWKWLCNFFMMKALDVFKFLVSVQFQRGCTLSLLWNGKLNM